VLGRTYPLSFCLWLAATLAFPAFGQPYVLTWIVDDNTQRPDGKGNFNISGAPAVPSFDGPAVVVSANGLSIQPNLTVAVK
jgi:hypothetical protein